MPWRWVVPNDGINKLYYRLLSIDNRVYAKRGELPNDRSLSCDLLFAGVTNH